MEDSDSEVSSNEGSSSLFSDTEPDLIALFQILIRNRARMRFDTREWCIGGMYDREDVDEGSSSSSTEPEDRLKRIDNSELKQDTLLRCGELCKPACRRSGPICKMLTKREIGLPDSQRFTGADRSFISSRMLPNKGRVMQRFDNKAFCGTHSTDGTIFLTASQDCRIRLYNTESSRYTPFKTIEARDVGWSILDTALSPDDRSLVYSSWSECIHFCNIHGNYDTHEALPLSPDDRRFCIFSLVFSADGQKVLGGANDGCLYVYDIDQRQSFRIPAHDDDVNTVAFADATSQILYSGSDDGLCKVWDLRVLNDAKPKPVGILAGHRAGITFVDPRGDGRHLITNGKDQCIKLWDMRVFSPYDRSMVTKLPGPHWDYRCDRVPKRYTSIGTKQLRCDTSLMTYTGHKVLRTLIRCHFSPHFTTGQRYIYTGCASGDVIVYDVLTGEIVKRLRDHKDCTRDVSWHPFKPELVSTSWDRTVMLWTYEEELEDEESTEDESNELKCRNKSKRLGSKITYNLRQKHLHRS